MRILTCEPGTEVSGATTSGFVQSITAEDYVSLITEYGYNSIDPEGWYPLERLCQFMNDLAQHSNGSPNLVATGMKIASVAYMPSPLQKGSFAQMVEGWNLHYQSNFRNGKVGNKTAVKVADQHYKIVLEHTIMPDDLEYGVLYGFAKRFLPPGTHFKVWYDPDVVRMDEGGDQTVIHVRWE